ncbi:MAG: hypothetical protein A2Y86_03860 [Candidatus Aminicenantes bacterium RBG_13_62_12]|nr:MAG: hypothetical protein A2Y86_03860 [Candidatus Aminicenantes bacterium RBG_13_62_12]
MDDLLNLRKDILHLPSILVHRFKNIEIISFCVMTVIFMGSCRGPTSICAVNHTKGEASRNIGFPFERAATMIYSDPE